MRRCDDEERVVLFYRDYQRYAGGHLKVWHYYQHLKASRRFRPSIFFSEQSVWTPDNPWIAEREERVRAWDPEKADILFLAGLDWRALPGRPPLPEELPIVNLIQHVRHADPKDPRYPFLSRKAVRICVSEQVTQHLNASGQVKGPVFTIPNCLDLDQLPPLEKETNRDIPVLVVGLKNPDLAKALATQLQERNVPSELQTAWMPRELFLQKLNHSEVAVLLPNKTEGFYLPALEAMALGALVVCPDCVGNLSFCRNKVNSLVPRYDLDDVLQATLRAYNCSVAERERLITAAWQTVSEHSLEQERKRFLEIMDDLGRLW